MLMCTTLALVLSAIASFAELSYPSPRAPIVVHILAARGPDKTPASAYLAAADLAFRARTDLAVRSIEQSGIEAAAIESCAPELRLSCWSRATIAEDARRYLLVIAVQPDALSAILIDLTSAAKVLRDAGLDEEAAEDAIFALAHRTPVHPAGTELAGYFDHLVSTELRALLELDGRWREHGALDLELADPLVRLELDGFPLDAQNATRVRVRDVPVGAHHLALAWPSGHRESRELAISASRTTELAIPRAPSEPNVLRPVLAWTGVSAATTGAMLVLAGAVKAGDGPRGACLIRPGASADACAGLGTPTFGWSPGVAPSTSSRELNPGGVAFVPLGISLAAAGVTWALATWYFGQEDEVPWFELAAGLAAGTLAYGTGVIFDDR
jgi:hypothetical protein